MELKEKLLKKKLGELNELKATVDTLKEMYGEKLTTYALMSGDNSLQNLSKEDRFNYEQRRKYQQMSETLQSVIIEKIDGILC